MALNFRKADRLRKFFNGCEITMETFERELCVRGYHVYQRIWTAAVGEVLHCEREPTNSRDRYAVAVKNNSLLKNIRALNFRKPGHLRKYCNNENFPIYGFFTQYKHTYRQLRASHVSHMRLHITFYTRSTHKRTLHILRWTLAV